MKKIKIALIIGIIAVGLYFLARWYVEKKYAPPREVKLDLKELQKEVVPLKNFEGNEK